MWVNCSADVGGTLFGLDNRMRIVFMIILLHTPGGIQMRFIKIETALKRMKMVRNTEIPVVSVYSLLIIY